MSKVRFSPSEYVIVSDAADVHEDMKRVKCQVKDFRVNYNEYELLVVEGRLAGHTTWLADEFLWSLDEYKLMRTIDTNEYNEYLAQIEHAKQIRDSIFKSIYGVIKNKLSLSDFKIGMNVTVKLHAADEFPWDLWTSDMDYLQGATGTVTAIGSKYNSYSNEYDDVIKVEFSALSLFSDYTYSYSFLPNHLEINK